MPEISAQTYQPSDQRYQQTEAWFRNCGRSGLKLPAIALGCWHNFGDAGTDPRKLSEADQHANVRAMLFAAFDHGVTHFDLANNYGPAPGSAEARVGRILKEDFHGYRDELIISTKAGYRMWPGPYGEWGSRKYLLASLDQSLHRLQLDYVDIFYSHRPDKPVEEGGTPLEETLGALDHAVRTGKALYAGISSYRAAQTLEVMRICERDGLVKPIIHQPSYSMLNRWIEPELLPVCHEVGLGTIAFCPLAQGLLTDKYIEGVPGDSRAASEAGALGRGGVKPEVIERVKKLNRIAQQRGQSLAQMALSWVLRDQGPGRGAVTTALIGASRPSQITENVAAAGKTTFSTQELAEIDAALAG